MGTKVRIQMLPNLERILGPELGVKTAINTRAEEAAAIARDLAPVSSGNYRDSIAVDGNELVATDWKAHWIEWGSIHNRAYAVLRNAATQVASRIVID